MTDVRMNEFQVSSGTVDIAKSILVDLLKKCNCDLKDEELTKIQAKVFPLVVQHMVREVVSPNHTVRAQVSYECFLNTAISLSFFFFSSLYFMQHQLILCRSTFYV